MAAPSGARRNILTIKGNKSSAVYGGQSTASFRLPDDNSVEKMLQGLFPGLANVKGKLSPEQQNAITNGIKYRMSKSIPELLLKELASSGIANFKTIDAGNKTRSSVWTPQGFGKVSEVILMGESGGGSPFADSPVSLILKDFDERLRQARGDSVLEASLLKEKAAIQEITESVYFKSLIEDIKGLGGQIGSFGALTNTQDIGFEMKMYGQADYLTGGQFTTSSGKGQNDVLIEAVAKLYSKMSMLFLMSYDYQAAFKRRSENRELIIRGASIFHELIFDRVLQGINFGLIEVSIKQRKVLENKTVYEVGINFEELGNFYSGVFGQAIRRANDVIEATRQSGLYRREIRLWDELGATSQEYFYQILQLLRESRLLDRRTSLRTSRRRRKR